MYIYSTTRHLKFRYNSIFYKSSIYTEYSNFTIKNLIFTASVLGFVCSCFNS